MIPYFEILTLSNPCYIIAVYKNDIVHNLYKNYDRCGIVILTKVFHGLYQSLLAYTGLHVRICYIDMIPVGKYHPTIGWLFGIIIKWISD